MKPSAALGLLAAALLRAALASPAPPARSGWDIVGEVPRGDSDEYLSLIRTNYKFRIQPDYTRYSLDILVDPCRDAVRAGGRGEACCAGSNIAACQHHADVFAGEDLQVAYFSNAHIANCRGTPFEDDPNCGTFLEIHRPADRRILADVGIDYIDFPSGYRTTRLPTHRLCVGSHEVWWVVRTPSASWVKKIRRFTVRSPSCDVPYGAAPTPESGLPLPAIP